MLTVPLALRVYRRVPGSLAGAVAEMPVEIAAAAMSGQERCRLKVVSSAYLVLVGWYRERNTYNAERR